MSARNDHTATPDAYGLLPEDESDRVLTENVHPSNWVNPEPASRYNIVVLGAGTAGLITAVIGAALGAKVALIEKHLMGGDCLTVGCVPLVPGRISAGRPSLESEFQTASPTILER
jgi:hypothetical protein